MGLVSETFDDVELQKLPGDVAVGHTRYSTTGSTVLANAQPCLVNYRVGSLSVAHNGNLTNAAAIKQSLVERGAIFSSSSDTEVLVHLIARSEAPDPEMQIRSALERVEGAYSLVIGVGRTLFAVVDPRGFRPLVLGRLGNGIVAASETCALDLVGATFIRELQPGEFVRIVDGVVEDLQPLRPRPVSRCVFELIYFARPDSNIFGAVGGPGPARGRAAPGAASTPPRAPTSSSPCRTAATPWRSGSARRRASSSSTASSGTTTWAAPSSTRRRRSGWPR